MFCWGVGGWVGRGGGERDRQTDRETETDRQTDKKRLCTVTSQFSSCYQAALFPTKRKTTASALSLQSTARSLGGENATLKTQSIKAHHTYTVLYTVENLFQSASGHPVERKPAILVTTLPAALLQSESRTYVVGTGVIG